MGGGIGYKDFQYSVVYFLWLFFIVYFCQFFYLYQYRFCGEGVEQYIGDIYDDFLFFFEVEFVVYLYFSSSISCYQYGFFEFFDCFFFGGVGVFGLIKGRYRCQFFLYFLGWLDDIEVVFQCVVEQYIDGKYVVDFVGVFVDVVNVGVVVGVGSGVFFRVVYIIVYLYGFVDYIVQYF